MAARTLREVRKEIAETRIALRTRRGGHAHTIGDWRAALDFATRQF